MARVPADIVNSSRSFPTIHLTFRVSGFRGLCHTASGFGKFAALELLCHVRQLCRSVNDRMVRLICVEVIPTSLNELKLGLEKLLVNHEDPT